VILARNFRTRAGEVDLIARDGSTIVFVEVKARRGSAHGFGYEAVTPAKQRRLVAAARAWAARHGDPGQAYRFDVISIDVGFDPPRVRHDRGAFGA
jgi:putative endonuclease